MRKLWTNGLELHVVLVSGSHHIHSDGFQGICGWLARMTSYVHIRGVHIGSYKRMSFIQAYVLNYHQTNYGSQLAAHSSKASSGTECVD